MKNITDFILFFSKKSNRGIVHIPFLINKTISFLIVSLFLLFTSSGNAIDNPFNFKFEVNKINYSNFTPPTPVGLITVTFTSDSLKRYLSVLAKNLSDNLSCVIVENYRFSGSSDTTLQFSVSFNFAKVVKEYNAPEKLKLTAYVTDFPQYSPFDNALIADTTTVIITEILYDIGGGEIPEEQILTKMVIDLKQPPDDSVISSQSRPDVDNIDLDSSGHPSTNTYAGDSRACAPAAAANSMKWLEKKYKDDIKLPQDMTLRKTLEELSSLMKREPNSGPSTRNMIIGKLDFIAKFNLPVEVKFQSIFLHDDVEGSMGTKATNLKKNRNDKPDWSFLRQMIEEGEDVEIIYAYKDTSGKWAGAHGVTVTGIEEFSSGVKKIMYKHDTNQRCPGGTKEETQKAGNDSDGWLRIGSSYEYYIINIIAESPEGSSRVITPVELTSSAAPLRYELAQNYPNPFNPETNFGFRIASASGGEFVSLKIYDVLGNEISILVNEEKPAGEYTIRFDASSLASGVYYYTLKAGSFVETKKMIVLK